MYCNRRQLLTCLFGKTRSGQDRDWKLISQRAALCGRTGVRRGPGVYCLDVCDRRCVLREGALLQAQGARLRENGALVDPHTTTANCIIIAQIPFENRSEQGQFTESAENNSEKCKIWAILMQFATFSIHPLSILCSRRSGLV